MAALTDPQKLSRYVEQVFAESGKTRWPTVRQAARAMRWTQTRVEATCDGDPDEELFLSSYYTAVPEPLGEHFVERYNPLPEAKQKEARGR
jgi:hypothetical protein